MLVGSCGLGDQDNTVIKCEWVVRCGETCLLNKERMCIEQFLDVANYVEHSPGLSDDLASLRQHLESTDNIM